MQPEGTLLLQTKLDVPQPRAHTLWRERLLASIPSAPGTRLVLLSAPAGFGKTTFLAVWCRALALRGTAVAWLALDEGDNALARFLAYLNAALAQAMGLPCVQSESRTAEGASAIESELVLTELLNRLAAFNHDLVLVLDDYHLIATPAVHVAVAFLLDHLPDHVRVAIGSRCDPPLPLARLRAREQLIELRAADLRFTPGEVQAFLVASDLALTPDEIEPIGAYVEGWPAGVQLVAHALRAAPCEWVANTGRPADPCQEHLLERLKGSQQHIFAYLADDVFERQPAYRKTFLLQTAILDRMCGPLCDAVLGVAPDEQPAPTVASGEQVGAARSNAIQPPSSLVARPSCESYSRLVLKELDQANLFVLPLDGERHWYRYHHLFRAFLCARLGHEPPGTIATLHRRASRWYQRNGLLSQAVEHALAAGEVVRAAEMMESSATAIVELSGNLALKRRLPPVVEPLSEREREVLRLIAEGGSNQVIAEVLVISVGTVKSHINHILGKLAARNRTEAVTRARELGLLAI